MGNGDLATRLRMHVSESRFRPYLDAAGADPERALRLYEWNARLAAALFVDLGHLEVALRNALDARMVSRHAALGRPGSWIDDPAGELGRDLSGGQRHRRPYRDILAARGRVRTNQKPDDHGQVISETGFGLWHQRVSKRWTGLWPDLAGAFPFAPDRARETVADPVSRLRDLRNRISHHHRVWCHPCADLHADLLAVAGYLSPELALWISHGSGVQALLASRPVPTPGVVQPEHAPQQPPRRPAHQPPR
jgi:hypothetical protein